MTRNIDKRLLIFVLLYVLLFILSACFTYAYYSKNRTSSVLLSVGEANVDMMISFNGLVIDENSPYFDKETHQVIVNVSDPESENALSKLKIEFVINPDYASRIRLKVMESYIKERYYYQSNESLSEVMAITESRTGFHPFSLLAYGQGYHMIYAEDGYQYYPNILNERGMLKLEVVNGGLMAYARQNAQFTESIQLRLSIVIEVVQANRYQEIWGVSHTLFD